MKKGLGVGVIVAVGVFSVVGAVTTAGAAQPLRMEMTRQSGGGGDGGGAVTKRSLVRYCDMLGYDADQRATATTIHEGYVAQHQEARKAFGQAVRDMQRSSEDTGDHGVFMERMPALERELTKKTAAAERQFFDDLHAVASGADQENAWPRVERARRIEVGLRRGSLSGESVDLADVVADLALPPEPGAALTTPLEEYQTELDRQIQARDKSAAEAPEWTPGQPLDLEAIRAASATARDGGMKVKELNERHAKRIEGLLPADRQAEFRGGVRKRAFPRVYKQPGVSRETDAALAMGDLTPAQRADIEEIRGQYLREAALANDAWAAAIEEAEKSGQSGAFSAGGGRVMLAMGDEPKTLVDSRTTRRELDERTRERLLRALTDAQRQKLPKDMGGGGEGEGAAGVSSELIIRSGG